MQIITHSLTVNSHAEDSHTEKPLLFVNKAQTDYSSRKLAQHYHKKQVFVATRFIWKSDTWKNDAELRSTFKKT